jgi:hypothetical protein
MTLVDTDYVNRATVDGVADAATVHSIDLLDLSTLAIALLRNSERCGRLVRTGEGGG